MGRFNRLKPQRDQPVCRPLIPSGQGHDFIRGIFHGRCASKPPKPGRSGFRAFFFHQENPFALGNEIDFHTRADVQQTADMLWNGDLGFDGNAHGRLAGHWIDFQGDISFGVTNRN